MLLAGELQEVKWGNMSSFQIPLHTGLTWDAVQYYPHSQRDWISAF